ncbi:MAG: TlyA family RNA methyltransferase [Candidatus Heimdallarchaeota archaeon]
MKERIDVLLVLRKLVESRTKAQWLIRNGLVIVDGKVIKKPGKKIDDSLKILLINNYPYVGRGGLKLEGALKEFSVDVEGKVCMDIGASVGGFTDCLLKNGAERVYAIDKATNLLHPSLINKRMRKNVIPMLGTDARELININEDIDICTIDITFASLKTILPNIRRLLKKNGDIIALVKPIFETEFEGNRKFIIIQNAKQLSKILTGLTDWCIKNKFYIANLIKSPLLGKEGSIEFFIHLKMKDLGLKLDLNKIIKNVIK